GIGQHRLEDGGIAQVTLAAVALPGQLKAPAAVARVPAQQAAEHRIAIHARDAHPVQPAPVVDQRGEAGIADDAAVEIRSRGHGRSPPSQALSSAGLAAPAMAALPARASGGPTRSERPPSSLTARNMVSSARSSPAATG